MHTVSWRYLVDRLISGSKYTEGLSQDLKKLHNEVHIDIVLAEPQCYFISLLSDATKILSYVLVSEYNTGSNSRSIYFFILRPINLFHSIRL